MSYSLDTTKFKFGYVALGLFIAVLASTVTMYGKEICKEPETITLMDTIQLLVVVYGIFVLGQTWGERTLPKDNTKTV